MSNANETPIIQQTQTTATLQVNCAVMQKVHGNVAVLFRMSGFRRTFAVAIKKQRTTSFSLTCTVGGTSA